MISLWQLLPILVRVCRNGLLPYQGTQSPDPRFIWLQVLHLGCARSTLADDRQAICMQTSWFFLHAVRMPSAVLTEVHCRKWRTHYHSQGLCACAALLMLRKCRCAAGAHAITAGDCVQHVMFVGTGLMKRPWTALTMGLASSSAQPFRESSSRCAHSCSRIMGAALACIAAQSARSTQWQRR